MQYTFRPHIYFRGTLQVPTNQGGFWPGRRWKMSDLWRMGSKGSGGIGLASMASITLAISYSLKGICGPSSVAAGEV